MDCDVCLQVILGRGLLIHVAALLDNLFSGHPTALLYFVMVMCPLCMNLVQVCPAVWIGPVWTGEPAVCSAICVMNCLRAMCC